jgi:hypothetical protein
VRYLPGNSRALIGHGLHPGHQFQTLEPDVEEEPQAGERDVQRHGRGAFVDQV